ncbi:biotin-dependent carboxyltransferase family protein [Robbsia sp. Bb-Pol-6]|uniref:Biotin-dependent carboxyltransferase family protein n=1 Tax=Robbsia betulipollinis TaxID=2981849 RepID=A0ABT3ZNT8_9BURK|nr:biotin-dependent carboxyltransferase family protein [Robbsia betulipollinis]MCY0388208.1 biotin-dependent carboxyltransferase family protein [Robbsia betulipollinis]
MIDILRAGLFSSVQDLGRTGHRHDGVGQSGALDTLALRVANRLVGNPETAAGIEFTVGQPVQLRFATATRIALTGADCAATLDGHPIHAWWSQPVAAGQVLSLGVPSRGMRAYLGVAGGIGVPLVLGSRSTDLKSGFGGHDGRALRDGDRLPLDGATAPAAAAAVPADALPFGVKPPNWCRFAQVRPALRVSRDYPRSGAEAQWVRMLRGPEYASFGPAAHDALWNAEWTVTPASNRMGYRLGGPALTRKSGGELLSHAVLPGTLQVPPGGQPILLMGDAQTAGGYPKLALVITADLWQLAQTRLNAPVRFVECSHADARQALLDIETYFHQLELAIRLQRERRLRSAA